MACAFAPETDARPYLVEAKLPREDDALEPELAHRHDAFEVVDGKLRGGMERKAREVPPAEPGDADVLDDERRRADLLELGEQAHSLIRLALADYGVEGYVHLLPAPARDGKRTAVLAKTG